MKVKFLLAISLLIPMGHLAFGAKKEGWKRVYLASSPRSGNHWMRYLIEEVTGIATSSAYCDGHPPHLPDKFPWGGYCPLKGYEGNRRYPTIEEPVVIKTHYFGLLPFVKAIRIIRHPIDSFYSHHVFKIHRNHGGVGDFSRIPRADLKVMISNWKRFQKRWDEHHDVLTIRYEDLMENPGHHLRKALTHIGYPFSDEDIERAVKRYPPEGTILKHLSHYDSSDLEFMRNELGEFLAKYGYEI